MPLPSAACVALLFRLAVSSAHSCANGGSCGKPVEQGASVSGWSLLQTRSTALPKTQVPLDAEDDDTATEVSLPTSHVDSVRSVSSAPLGLVGKLSEPAPHEGDVLTPRATPSNGAGPPMGDINASTPHEGKKDHEKTTEKNYKHRETQHHRPTEGKEKGEEKVEEGEEQGEKGEKGEDKGEESSEKDEDKGEENSEKGEEEGKEGEENGEAEAEENEKAGKPVAIMMISTIIIISLVFAMTHTSNEQLADCTVLAVDNTLSIFMAVLWFQILNMLIETLPHPHHQVLASMTIAVSGLLVALVLSWFARSRGHILAVVAGCGAHVVGFQSMHAAYIAQRHFFSDHWHHCILGIFITLVCMLLISGTFYYFKKVTFQEPGVASPQEDVNDWAEAADDIETDFVAIAVSLVMTEFVRFLIVGKFPQLQGADFNMRHTTNQRLALLLWGCCVAVVGSYIDRLLAAFRERTLLSYSAKRAISFVCTLMPMCTAWAFLDVGQWYMYENTANAPIIARIIFAVICTMAGLCCIAFLAIPQVSQAKLCSPYFFVQAFSLMAAWSWEQAFDATFEENTFSVSVKLAVTAGVSVVVLSTMVFYLKPITHSIKHRMKSC